MDYALSLKQPWATLLVHGRKTIEIRRWATQRLGRILIHAARVPDNRPEAWAHVPASLASFVKLNGGIVGEAHLVECRTYRDRSAFMVDRGLHLNQATWFQPPALYGFVFACARPLPFVRQAGSLHFFEVPSHPPPEVGTNKLLVSVRSALEAEVALTGGADVIDIKEPERGSLGRASSQTIIAIVRKVAGQVPVSAAMGELCQGFEGALPPGLAFVKWGLAGLGGRSNWARRLSALQNEHGTNVSRPVTVAYADCKLAKSPPWQSVASFALERPGSVLLIDTFDKTWHRAGDAARPATLLDWVSEADLYRLAQDCRAADVRLALAGSLGLMQIHRLLAARPAWFAVRGAVCAANQRESTVHPLKVRALAELLRWSGQPASA